MRQDFYMLEKGKECTGWAHSVCSKLDNDTLIVHYTNGLTLEQYQEQNNKEYDLLTWEEFEKKVTTYEQTLKTKPKRITKARYWEMLEVLPPSRFDGNVFHICERLTGNLVAWFFSKNEKYYEFTEEADISETDLSAIIRAV